VPLGYVCGQIFGQRRSLQLFYNEWVPANLTPEYFEAEEQFKLAETTHEKMSALKEMLRAIPKHKGTEKMQADLKRRLARLRKESQREKSSGAHRRPFYHIDREGAGRVVLCGPPNSGKSTILDRLTHADPHVADYPYTTRVPLPGMMEYEDIQIQLVDMPPLAPEILEPWQLAMIEQADLAALFFDITDPNLLDQTEFVLSVFADRQVPLEPAGESHVLVFGNKVDLPGGEESFRAWAELFEHSFTPVAFSAKSAEHLEAFRGSLFCALCIVRVYTRNPGSSAEEDLKPYVLKQGSTVLQAARAIHKDLAEGFKFARIWGKGKYDGQMVERDYLLQDGDLLEIHT
jgi:ribosome-interacting GTPase 1